MTALSDLILALDEASDLRKEVTLTAEQVAIITGNTTLLDDLKKIVEGGLPPTLTIDDICADLKLSRQSIWRKRKAGKFVRSINGSDEHPRFDRTEYVNWKLGRHAA